MTGHKLRLVREFRNYSQEYIASKLGITQNSYSRIENNLTKISADRLKLLAEILSISLSELLSDTEPVIHFSNLPYSAKDKIENPEKESGLMRELYEQIINIKDEKINYLELEIKLLRDEKARMISLVEKLTVGIAMAD
jgi:transcriptional regulator with XRE-family HTH domain